SRHLAERPHNPVLEHFAPDKTDIGVALGLFGQVLAGTKTDLEPNLFDRLCEQRVRIDRAPLRQPDCQTWQQFLFEALLAGPPRSRPPPPVQSSGRDALYRAGCHAQKVGHSRSAVEDREPGTPIPQAGFSETAAARQPGMRTLEMRND